MHGYQKYVQVPSTGESPQLDLGKTTLLLTAKSSRPSNFTNGHAFATRMVSSDDIRDNENVAALEETAEVRVSLHSEYSLDDYNIADYADLAYASDERSDSLQRDIDIDLIKPVATIPIMVVSPSPIKQAVSIPGEGVEVERKLKKKKKSLPPKEELKNKERLVARKATSEAPTRMSKVRAAPTKQPVKVDTTSPRKPSVNAVVSSRPAVTKTRNKGSGVAAPLRTNSHPLLEPKSSVEPILTTRPKTAGKPPSVLSSKAPMGSKDDRLTTALLRKSFGIVGAIKRDTKKGSERARITRRST